MVRKKKWEELNTEHWKAGFFTFPSKNGMKDCSTPITHGTQARSKVL